MMYSNFFNLHFIATKFKPLWQLLILPMLFLLSCQSENSKESDSTTSLPEQTNSDQEIGVYELRTYYASEGNLENLLSRFRDHTLLLFEKHGMKNIAYWVPTQNDENTLIYMLGHQSREALEASFSSFREDVEWLEVKEASEVDGSLVDSIHNTFLNPTRFSTTLEIKDEAPRVFELRTYYTNAGKLENLHLRFQDHTMKIFEKHEMTNVVYFNLERDQQGADNTLVYIISHRNEEAAKKNWQAFIGDPEWTSAYQNSITDGNLVESLTSEFMTSTDFSPLK
jgi:hypothetical protein